jgi:hypothetical protein
MIIYALEVSTTFKWATRCFILKPGGSVYAPTLIPHAWHDVGATTPGKMLVVAQPAGQLEAFAEDLEKLSAGKKAGAGSQSAV